MTGPISTEWWQRRAELARLLRWLHAHPQHGPLTAEKCMAVVDEPWHLTRVYRQMVREQDSADLETNEALLQASVATARGARR